MNVETGTEAAQFLEKVYKNGISLQCGLSESWLWLKKYFIICLWWFGFQKLSMGMIKKSSEIEVDQDIFEEGFVINDLSECNNHMNRVYEGFSESAIVFVQQYSVFIFLCKKVTNFF